MDSRSSSDEDLGCILSYKAGRKFHLIIEELKLDQGWFLDVSSAQPSWLFDKW